MEKLGSFILCAILIGLGVAGSYAEIARVTNYPMCDEQWVGEILLIIVYGGMAVFSAIRIVRLWNSQR